jgi:hypothetical protein
LGKRYIVSFNNKNNYRICLPNRIVSIDGSNVIDNIVFMRIDPATGMKNLYNKNNIKIGYLNKDSYFVDLNGKELKGVESKIIEARKSGQLLSGYGKAVYVSAQRKIRFEDRDFKISVRINTISPGDILYFKDTLNGNFDVYKEIAGIPTLVAYLDSSFNFIPAGLKIISHLDDSKRWIMKRNRIFINASDVKPFGKIKYEPLKSGEYIIYTFGEKKIGIVDSKFNFIPDIGIITDSNALKQVTIPKDKRVKIQKDGQQINLRMSNTMKLKSIYYKADEFNLIGFNVYDVHGNLIGKIVKTTDTSKYNYNFIPT